MTRRARRIATAVALLGILAIAAEALARLALPRSGLTPFRASAHPRLPAELRPGHEGIYTGVRVRVNSHGMRGPELLPRVPDRARVLLVGDSFVFGSGVEEDGTLAARLADVLRERGRDVEVLNLGVPGYNAEDAADVIAARAGALEPDAIVFVFFGNDTDPRQPRADPPATRRIDPRYGFPLRSAFLQWSYLRGKNLALSLGIDVDARSRAEKAADVAGEAGARVAAAFDEMVRTTRGLGVPLLVAVYPFLTYPATNPFAPADALALRLADERGIPRVHLLAAVLPTVDPHGLWANAFDSHPGRSANAAAAIELGALLLRHLPPEAPAAGPP